MEKTKAKKYKIITKYSDEKSDNVVISDGTYGLKKETLKRTWVENLKDYQFEDRVYPGISDSDAYLTYLYGDYMEVPPLDKRNHHSRLNVDFGPYGDDN
ncbi:LicD family protein [Lactobacillus delbrueckii subsp. bulgaricus]